MLVFSDLLTGQHVQSLMASQAEEATPWACLQCIIFMMGLFHLKMACADAIWKMFIQPKLKMADKDTLINLIGEIQPNEMGIIESNPGFRCMHEVIQHVGVVSWLNVWWIAAGETRGVQFETLDDFAASKPSWDDLFKMALHFHEKCVTKTELIMLKHMKPVENRDQQHENILLMHQYFLLYEEMSCALNYGDIDQVEALFLLWMCIFCGCGKH